MAEKCCTLNTYVPESELYDVNTVSGLDRRSSMNFPSSTPGESHRFSMMTSAGIFNPVPAGGCFDSSGYTATRPSSISMISRSIDNDVIPVKSTGDLNDIDPNPFLEMTKSGTDALLAIF